MNTATITGPKPEHLDVHCEGDLAVAQIRGAYDESVARYLESIFIQQADQYGYRIALIDASKTTTITPEARRLMTQWNVARKDRMVGAIVGASFATKTITTMLVRAFTLITKLPVAVGFFDTEAEARVWVDLQRLVVKGLHQ